MIDRVDRSVVRDRIRGMMLGAAIGDALGSAFEMVRSDEIHRRFGSIVGDYRVAVSSSLLAGRPAGLPTDDTAMALSLATAIAERFDVTPASVAARFAEDLAESGAFGELFHGGGPGGACLSMLDALDRGSAPFENINPNAGGNGAAMRAHPCGVLPTMAQAEELAAMQARLSHPHPAAVASAVAVVAIAHVALYEGRLLRDLPASVRDEQMMAAWKRFHAADVLALEPDGSLPPRLRDVDMAGWNTVAAAHAIAVLYADEFAGGVGAAAASGGDTDTVANIVGGMLGAVHGARALPQHLLDGLAYRDDIERVADTLADAILDRRFKDAEHAE